MFLVFFRELYKIKLCNCVPLYYDIVIEINYILKMFSDLIHPSTSLFVNSF